MGMMATDQPVRVSELPFGLIIEVHTLENNDTIQIWKFKVLSGDSLLPLTLNEAKIAGPAVQVVGSQPPHSQGPQVPTEFKGRIALGMHLVLYGQDPFGNKYYHSRLGRIVAIE